MELIADWDTDVIGVYVVETSTPFLTPKKVKEMMVTELTQRGKQVLDAMEENSRLPTSTSVGSLRKGIQQMR